MGWSSTLKDKRRFVSSTSVIAVSAIVVAAALVYDGEATADLELNDSGVWVTKTSTGELGRFNYESQALDGTLLAGSSSFDVQQAGQRVLLDDDAASSAAPVDPAHLVLDGALKAPKGAQVISGGATTAIVDAADGRLWVLPFDGTSSFEEDRTEPTAEFKGKATGAVGPDGTVYVALPSQGQLLEVPTTANGAPQGKGEQERHDLPVDEGADVEVTVVGDDPVVLDRTGGRLVLPGGDTVDLEDAAEARLQQPSAEADDVLVATPQGLFSQPVGGGTGQLRRSAGGAPSAPVQVAGCAYAAWVASGQGVVLRDCEGTDRDLDTTLDGLGSDTALEYRVNRQFVVLNDLAAGTLWMAADDFEKVDDWKDKDPFDEKGDDGESEDSTLEQVDQVVVDRDKPNNPPTVKDETLGLRPGRTTVLPVLSNDFDRDGDTITASVVDPPEAEGFEVQRIMGGAALQVVAGADVSGTTTFTYEVSDGRPNGTAQATTTLKVSPEGENAAPEQPGEPVLKVESGGSATIDVLPYFQDPDGDDLVLSSASSQSRGDEVTFEPDGTVELTDGGGSTGRKVVDLTVSDGLGVTGEGKLLVDVVSGEQPPIPVNDHVEVLAGEAVTVSPLDNDADPNGDDLQLTDVAEVAGADIATSPESDRFTFTSATPGSYDVTYQVSDGPSASTGLVRVDVIAPDDAQGAPVVVSDRALLPAGGSTLVDVLANDSDPAGGVLVVQSVEAPEESGVGVAVLAHHVLRVTETRRLEEPVTVRYTVSNGTQTADGEVRVVPVPAASRLQPPEAEPDEVTVHTGDVVTVPVLKNDTHPDGLELTLRDELVEAPEGGVGEAFVAGDTVRFKAGPTAGTTHAVYEVTDPNGQKDAAQLTIRVRDGAANTAPQPPEVEARVLSGSAVRVDVDLDGIDVDGDSVTLTGVSSAPAKGTAEVKDGSLVYTAGETSSGTDTFRYAVQDARGATATGTARVGIALTDDGNQPPAPTDDEVTVRPERTVAVPVLSNDSDPDGDQISLVDDGLEAAKEYQGRIKDDQVVVQSPAEEGTGSFYYTVQDPLGSRAGAAVTVKTRADAPLLRPVAEDDVVSDEQAYAAKEAVTVDVRANDADPDGTADALEVSVDEATAAAGVRVTDDGALAVPVTAERQVVTYTVTDMDGLEAKAFVHVPGVLKEDQRPLPHLKKAAPIEVVAGEPFTLDLEKVVEVAPGHEPRLTEEEKVSGLEGAAEVTGPTEIVYTPAEGYSGPASVTFEVTDGSGPDDPDGLTALLTQPVDVVPPENLPPEITRGELDVAAGETGTLNLARLAEDPDGDPLTFTAESAKEGMTVTVAGTQLEVQAGPGVPKGSVVPIEITANDGTNAPVSGQVDARVVASTRELARANDDRVADAHQGQATSVRVLDNDTNPFPGEPLHLVSGVTETGSGDVAVKGDQLVVTPGKSFVGVMVVRYRVQDATEDPAREVEGRVHVTVLGKPETPRAPRVEEVRSETVVLSWEPPNDNGSPITSYTVRSSRGDEKRCASTTCTITGLTNDQEYTFTVVATNDVGPSSPSPASASATPDERPDPPAAPRLKFGDKRLTVSWTNKSYTDRSPIECVNLEISPAPASGAIRKECVSGTSATWDGLTNGTAYRVRVQAKNGAPEPSDWGAYSAEEIPAGKPGAPAAPTATRVNTALGGQVKVTWKAAPANGDTPSTYWLDVLRGGSVDRTIKVGGGGLSQTVEGLSTKENYTFRVTAQNKAGKGTASAASKAVVPYGTPATPSGVKASLYAANNTSRRAQVAWTNISSGAFRGPGGYYQVRANGSGARNAGSNPFEYTGLTNGTSYTFQVRACNEYTCSAWSGKSNAVKPFTTPGTPGISWARSGTNDGAFTVKAPASNGGSALKRIEYQRSWTSAGKSTSWPFSVGVPAAYGKSYTLKARACNAAGCGSWVSKTGTTAAKPKISLKVGRTGSYDGKYGSCSGDSCSYLTLTIRNATANKAFTYRCYGSGGDSLNSGPISARTNSNGSYGEAKVPCFYGKPGKQVWIETSLGTTNKMTW